MTEEQERICRNRLTAINKLHTYINKVVPLLIADIRENSVKVKTSGEELYAKDKERLNAIVDKDTPENSRCYISVSNYRGVYLHTDIHYNVNQHAPNSFGVAYYKLEIHLTNSAYNPRAGIEELPIYDIEKELVTFPRIAELEAEISNKKCELNKLKNLLIGR